MRGWLVGRWTRHFGEDSGPESNTIPGLAPIRWIPPDICVTTYISPGSKKSTYVDAIFILFRNGKTYLRINSYFDHYFSLDSQYNNLMYCLNVDHIKLKDFLLSFLLLYVWYLNIFFCGSDKKSSYLAHLPVVEWGCPFNLRTKGLEAIRAFAFVCDKCTVRMLFSEAVARVIRWTKGLRLVCFWKLFMYLSFYNEDTNSRWTEIEGITKINKTKEK